jgi:hypothetical protein
VQILHALKPDDKPHCFQIAKEILSYIEADENYLQRWMFSDEESYFSGRVNHNDCRIWG